MRKILNTIDKGILYMLLASLCFAFTSGFAKLVSQHLPGVEVTFFRNIAGVILVGISLYRLPPKEAGGKPLLLFFRGMMGFLALLSYFYIIAYMPLGEVVTYNKTSPMFVAIFAYLLLNEKLTKASIFAIIMGFVGILLVAQPLGGSFDKYDILGLFSGVGAALAYTSIRELRAYYDTRTIVMSFMAVGTIAPMLLMFATPYVDVPKSLDFMFSAFVIPYDHEWVYLLFLGLFATVSQLLMTKAYSLSKAGVVGTIGYTNIIFAEIIGVLLGDAFPNMWTTLGITLVILSGIVVALAKEK